jgi:hypothetical protein
MADTNTATLRHVQRNESKDVDEKPYILHYAAPDGFPQNNFTIKPVHGIKVRDLRTSGVTYEERGIGMAPINSSGMDPENFDDDDWVERVYLPELHRSVCDALGAKDMTIFDWMLRKRAPSFPVRKPGEENGEAHQPSLSAHIGEIVILIRFSCGFDSNSDQTTPRPSSLPGCHGTLGRTRTKSSAGDTMSSSKTKNVPKFVDGH